MTWGTFGGLRPRAEKLGGRWAPSWSVPVSDATQKRRQTDVNAKVGDAGRQTLFETSAGNEFRDGR